MNNNFCILHTVLFVGHKKIKYFFKPAVGHKGTDCKLYAKYYGKPECFADFA